MPDNTNSDPTNSNSSANPPISGSQSSGSSGQQAGDESAFTPLPDEQSNNGSGQASSGQTGIPLAKVATKQIKITKEDIEKFDISEDFAKTNPALVDLILKTESMKDEERKYWFQLLPIMTEEQVKKLEDILQNEQSQLAELDAKYESEVSKLNNQPATQWKAEEARKKREEIARREQQHQQKEASKEQDILDQLDNI